MGNSIDDENRSLAQRGIEGLKLVYDYWTAEATAFQTWYELRKDPVAAEIGRKINGVSLAVSVGVVGYSYGTVGPWSAAKQRSADHKRDYAKHSRKMIHLAYPISV